MESLLTVAFNNIASREIPKIKKGIRQIESLLSQLCLIRSKKSLDHRLLSQLNEDPAFREFFRIQDSFQWNIASRLIATLEHLLGMSSTSQTDVTIFHALELLQGVLLLHPPSRLLFSREIYMNLLLDLLDAANPPKIQSQAVLVLVTTLLDTPQNVRIFEEIDGLACVSNVFKSRSTTKEVKMRTLEFLYFYLMPERPSSELQDSSITAHDTTKAGLQDDTRSTEQKQLLLGKHLNSVAQLVSDLKESSPFGACF